jgi:2-keto-4-pentenoate hydratase
VARITLIAEYSTLYQSDTPNLTLPERPPRPTRFLRFSIQGRAMTFNPHLFAAELLAARRTRKSYAPKGNVPIPRSRADAYAVQAVVDQEIGPPGGFKTGRTNPSDTPIMAPIPRDCVRRSPAQFDAGAMRLVGVEIEIAFRLESELPPLDATDFEARLREVVSILPAIEVVDCRLTDANGTDPIAKLADNQFGYGLVVGNSIPLTEGVPVNAAEIRFMVDDAVLGSGWAEVPGGDGFATFAAFVKTVGDHCGGLRPGYVVTTGALCGLHFVNRNSAVTGTIGALGDVLVRFEEPL